MDEEIIRIKDLAEILKTRWKIIVLITAIATIFAIVMSFYVITPKYQANTKVFIGKENNKNQDYNNIRRSS